MSMCLMRWLELKLLPLATPIQADDARDLRAQLAQQKVSESSIPISMCLRPEGPTTTVLRSLEC